MDALGVLETRICLFRVQDALLMLCYSLAAPRLMSLLQTAPCFQSSQLHLFDKVLRRILSSVCNILFSCNEFPSMHTSLLVRYGSLRVRSVVYLAPSAFLASVAGSVDLVDHIVLSSIKPLDSQEMDAALAVWSRWHVHPPPVESASFSQRE